MSQLRLLDGGMRMRGSGQDEAGEPDEVTALGQWLAWPPALGLQKSRVVQAIG